MAYGNPLLGDAKVDKILTQFSQRYTPQNLIGTKILPVLKVKEKTGKFAKYGTENLNYYSDQILRAPGTRALTIDYTVSQGEYICRERAVEKPVPDELRNNTDDPYDPMRDGVATCMDIVMLNQEKTLADTLSDTGVITQNETLSGNDQWSDYNNSEPLQKIQEWYDTIVEASGLKPTQAWMNRSVMTTLKNHPAVREQLKYTGGAGNVSISAFVTFMKEFFDLEEIHVADAVINTADEGQTSSLSPVWEDNFWLARKTPRPSLMDATFGYTFMDVENKVETYREEAKVSDVVRVRMSYDQNIMDTNLVYLGEDVIA